MLLGLFGRQHVRGGILNLHVACRRAGSTLALETLAGALYACGIATDGCTGPRREHARPAGDLPAAGAGRTASVPMVYGPVDLMLAHAVRIVAGSGGCGAELPDGAGAGAGGEQQRSVHEARSFAAFFLCVSAARAEPREVVKHLDGAADVLRTTAADGPSASQRSIESFARGVANIAVIFNAFAGAEEAIGWQPPIDTAVRTILACAMELPQHASAYLATSVSSLASGAEGILARLHSPRAAGGPGPSGASGWPTDLPLAGAIERFPDARGLAALQATIVRGFCRGLCSGAAVDGEQDGVRRAISALEALSKSRTLFAATAPDGRRLFGANNDVVQSIKDSLKAVAEQPASAMPASAAALGRRRVCSLLIDFTRCDVKQFRPLAWRILRAVLLHSPGGAARGEVSEMIGEGVVAALEGSAGVARAALDVCPTLIAMIPSHARDVVACMMRLREYSVLTCIATAGLAA